MENKPYTFDRVFRIALTLTVIVVVLWLFNFLAEALIPFAIAFLLAYMINPIVCWVQKKIPHRMAAVLITLIALGLAFSVFVYLVSIPIRTEIAHVKEKMTGSSDYKARLKTQVKKYEISHYLYQTIKGGDKKDLINMFKDEKYMSILQSGASEVFPVAKNIFRGVLGLTLWLLGLTMILLYLIFILADYQSVRNNWHELLPPKWRGHITAFVKEFDAIMNRHFRAQAIVAFLVGILFAIGFYAIGLPMGILLGLFIGVLNMIPYMQVLGLLPAAFLAIMMAVEAQTGIPLALFKVVAVFAVVQVFQDAYLVPRIMGKVTGLKPAMILLAISIWGKLMGFLGLLIALPMTCLFLAYYRRFILKKNSDG